MDKEAVKAWWDARKGYFKTAFVFGGAGLLFGIIKGMSLEAQHWGRLMDKIPDAELLNIDEIKEEGVTDLADQIKTDRFATLWDSDGAQVHIRLDGEYGADT